MSGSFDLLSLLVKNKHMDTEDLGPSQEEMGIDSDEKLTESSTSKETDQK